MQASPERTRILEMIESGKISAAQGLALLQALGSDAMQHAPEGGEREQGREYSAPAAAEPEIVESLSARTARWKRWWAAPLWGGAALVTLGGLLAYAGLSGGVNLLLLLCALSPLALGILMMLLAWISRTSPWLYLDVQQPPGAWPQRLAFGMPLPLGLAAWFVRRFGAFIPAWRDMPVEQVLHSLRRSTAGGSPLLVEVDEGDGEKVEIYIG
jgi:hypothetical protein